MTQSERQTKIAIHSLHQLVDLLEKEWNRDRSDLALILMDYEDKFGEPGIIDLYAWLVYAVRNDIKYPYTAIGHDVNGRNEDHMLPRTDGYGVEVWGDDYSNFKFA